MDGFRSMLVYLPEEKLAVAYSNGVVYRAQNIIRGALESYQNKPFQFRRLNESPSVDVRNDCSYDWATMIGRREFCFGTLAFLAATFTGCKEHVPVLKIPEDADECFDLFRFFTDPAFQLEQARNGLGVNGEPRVQDLKTRKLFTFENQPGILKSINFQTGPDGEPDANMLDAIYIYYRTPISVSLGRLESLLGRSNRHDKKIAAQIAMFTNLQPGQKEKERSSFGFYPEEPIAPGHLKGNLLFSCDTTSWDTKSVDFLRYERRLNL